MKRRGIFVAVLVAAIGAASLAMAAPVSIENGDFETGDFVGWETFERGDGEWFVYGESTPRGIPLFPPAPQGDFAAGLTQGGPGVNILHRVLKLKRNKVNRIKFELYYENFNERFHSPKTFDFGGEVLPRGGKSDTPNQQLRVDVMRPGAPIKALGNKAILATLLHTRPGDPLERDYAPLKANLTRLGIKAKRVRLRIAEVDNEGEFFVGVDALKQKAG